MSEVQVIRNHSKFYVLPLLLALEPDYKNFNYNQISNTFLFQYKEDLDKYLETEELKYINLIAELKEPIEEEKEIFFITNKPSILETVNLLLKGKYSKIKYEHKNIIASLIDPLLITSSGERNKHPVHVALFPSRIDREYMATQFNVDIEILEELGTKFNLEKEVWKKIIIQ
jgi:hypothetical protein